MELWDVVAGSHDGTLATIKKDGRPQLSDVSYLAEDRLISISTRVPLAKVHNLKRDPRASLHTKAKAGHGYAVAEAIADLSEPARDINDATVEELVELYRKVRGEHPDWDEYRRVMVEDARIVLRLQVERVYGWFMEA
ncbi:PPOX class F420-dependent oxidoreductase [Actinoplanes sp. NPDC049265]|uniref:PPOX class F420-dependent oxidoreductase n=1 Tax=Actinoplanes sp. NPDC049265 TaxID=3363902 RepID=UPI0037213721